MLEKLFHELVNNKQIEILTLDVQKAEKNDGIKQVILDNEVKLHPSLERFYSEYKSFRVLWSSDFKIDNETVSIDGHINLLPLKEVLNGPLNNKWKENLWFSFHSEEEQEKLKVLRPFDMFYTDDTNCTCLTLNDNCLGENLIMSSVDYGLHNLSMNIDEYFEMLYLTKGIVRWPFLISKNKNLYNYEGFVNEYRQAIETLFPESIKLQHKLIV